MTDTPFMPKATAVWLVENTTLTFKQIAKFCNLHELEVKGIADGDVAKGIKAYNPILAGQLSREEIELSSKDENRKLTLLKKIDEFKPRYIIINLGGGIQEILGIYIKKIFKYFSVSHYVEFTEIPEHIRLRDTFFYKLEK